jgi:hypothetical protein
LLAQFLGKVAPANNLRQQNLLALRQKIPTLIKKWDL